MVTRAVRHPLVLLGAALAFGMGLAFPGAPALGGLPESVPGVETAAAEELDCWNSYYQALQLVEDRYYGELPHEMPLTYAAVRGMLRTLDDPFTRFMDPREYKGAKDESEGEYVGIGVYLDQDAPRDQGIAIERVIPNGPAARAGVRPGDRITHVNGVPVKGMDTEKLSSQIRGAPKSTVRLTLRRPGRSRPLTLRVVRQKVEYEVVESVMKEGKIGYVRLTLFSNHAGEQVARAVHQLAKQGMKGLVLDLRGNPGGVLEAAEDVVSCFVPPGNLAVVIVEAGGRREEHRVDAKKHLKIKAPLAVLVDGYSASASEIVAGAIKDTGAGTIVGETTFGKGLVQSIVELPGGSAVAITSAKYLTSKGNDINRQRGRRGGVEPDVRVSLSDQDLAARRDPQLDRALQVLRQKIARGARR